MVSSGRSFSLSPPKTTATFAFARIGPTLYGAPLFLSAVLLFSIQPMFTKMILPRLARISHTNRRIGAPNQRKLLCRNDFTQIQGDPRCGQSVAQNGLILEPWQVGLWKRRSMPDW